MANKAISELPQALNVNNQDLFVLEQSGIAKKLTAETFITEQGIIDALAEALDGHGGISSVTLSSVSGRIRTYLITFTDETTTTFQVLDGTSIDRIVKTSTAGLTDTYTVFMNDGTTTFFTVTNGADGTVSEAMLNDALKDKAPAITETTESSAIANFTDGADDLVMHNIVAEIAPVQSGSGDPSPDNIRPITGWTGCNVTRTGKNLLPQMVDGTYTGNGVTAVVENGIATFSGTTTASGNALIIPLSAPFTVPSTTAYVHLGNSAVNGQVAPSFELSTDASNTSVAISFNPANRILEIPSSKRGVAWDRIRFYLGSGVTLSGTFAPMVCYDSTATSYEPYITPSTISIDWSTEAGTVYGGTLDAKTGVLTVTHQLVQLRATASWAINNNAGYTSLSALGITPPMKNPPVGTPNRTLTRTNWCKTNALIPTSTGWSGTASSNNPQFVISYDDFLMMNIGVAHPTSAQINQFITDVGLQLYYPLATAQTYQLAPQEVRTLLGTNNVWADTGDVSVTYAADTKMFIEKLTMPTEDDLVANQAITSGKYFMIGNSLYLALANIASGAQITIGTNAQRVSLADALNTINS